MAQLLLCSHLHQLKIDSFKKHYGKILNEDKNSDMKDIESLYSYNFWKWGECLFQMETVKHTDVGLFLFFSKKLWIVYLAPVLVWGPRGGGGTRWHSYPLERWPHTRSHQWGDKGRQAPPPPPWAPKHKPSRSDVQVWKPSEPGVRGPERGQTPESIPTSLREH